MISFIQKNLYTYFAIYIVNIIEYRLATKKRSCRFLNDSSYELIRY